MIEIVLHSQRSLIEISGSDRNKFLQGLITNDITKLESQDLIYTAMLNAQGRFLYDFFIFSDGDKLFLDCAKNRKDEIIKKFSLYKLRSDVKISENTDLLAGQYFGNEKVCEKQFIDPRHTQIGFRIYFPKNESEKFSFGDENFYNFKRISNKIAESELDLTYEKSIILEFGFEELNAVDYKKGCYVGQELISRTHYSGEIRKKIFYLTFPQTDKLERGLEVFLNQEKIGKILSSVFFDGQTHALALLRATENINTNQLVVNQHGFNGL
jgi:folate-binding protein YgfZ